MADPSQRHTIELSSSKDRVVRQERQRSSTDAEADPPKKKKRSKEDRKSQRKSKSEKKLKSISRNHAEESCEGEESPKEKKREKRSRSAKRGTANGSPSKVQLSSSAPVPSVIVEDAESDRPGSRLINLSSEGAAESVASRQMRKQGMKKERPLSLLFQGALMVAHEQYSGEGDEELSFEKGDVIMFIEKDENGWVRGECNDKTGWFPRSHVKLLPGMKSKLFEEDSGGSNRGSIIEKKAETKSKLGKFLALRPTQKDLQERGTILAKDDAAKSDDVDKGDKKKKREYLKRFMSVRGMRVKPTEKKAVKVFGSSLSELSVEGDDNPVPRIVRSCVAYLQAVRCEEVEGIFRKSGNNNLLNTLKDKFKSPVDEADLRPLCEDPHVVAVLLKQFLGSMSDPIVPCSLYESFITQFGAAQNEEDRMENMKAALSELPQNCTVVLEYLIRFLIPIAANHEVNKMTPANLGVVFGPNVFRPLVQTQITLMDSTSSNVVEFLIQHYDDLFSGCSSGSGSEGRTSTAGDGGE